MKRKVRSLFSPFSVSGGRKNIEIVAIWESPLHHHPTACFLPFPLFYIVQNRRLYERRGGEEKKLHTWPGWRRQSIHERENELSLLCKNAKLFPSSFVFVSNEEALKLGTNFSSLCISRPTHTLAWSFPRARAEQPKPHHKKGFLSQKEVRRTKIRKTFFAWTDCSPTFMPG